MRFSFSKFGDWEENHDGLIQEALQRMKTPESTRQEAEYLQTLFTLPVGSRILDVPCGFGRHALELAAKGYRMTGIDISQQAVEKARQDAATLGVPFDVQQGDMRVLPWTGEFDGVCCFWESFGYFDDAGNRQFLEAVFRALKPGGKFVLDTHLIETVMIRFHPRDWSFRGGDMIILENHFYDADTSTFHRQMMFIKGDRAERRNIPYRLYSYHELTSMLADIGFVDLKAYNFLTTEPFNVHEAPRLALVATRPA